MNELGPIGEAVRENVRQVRKAQRLTYVEISDRLASVGRPIPVLGLRRIERGERRVDVDDLMALCKVLGMNAAGLLDRPTCSGCQESPPAGFTCNQCGRGAT